ncbi:MAG: YncE family protein [Treponema sp.]|jgi:DNA-binding beta-propeller fold protein YncE|nr:YncE family protein [Treponema sp.]
MICGPFAACGVPQRDPNQGRAAEAAVETVAAEATEAAEIAEAAAAEAAEVTEATVAAAEATVAAETEAAEVTEAAEIAEAAKAEAAVAAESRGRPADSEAAPEGRERPSLPEAASGPEVRDAARAAAIPAAGPDFPCTLLLKSGPPDLRVFHNGGELRPLGAEAGIRRFMLEAPGLVRLEAAGYTGKSLHTREIPGLLRDGQFQVKLENEGGMSERLQELSTGRQPKSAYFSPGGDRLFVPLLGQRGVDVFRFTGNAASAAAPKPGPKLVFEKRLAVPGSNAGGFVEAFCDGKRRELWVSNMEENRVHIFDLDSLEYKCSAGTGGIMPKAITQSPAGDLTVVSNWLSRNISVFDSATKERLALIPVDGTPRGMAFSPDGKTLYAAVFDGPLIAVIDMAAKKTAATYRLYEGAGAARHVICSEGKLFVSDMYRGNVCILDAASGKLLAAVRAGPNINTIVLSPDGKRIYASSRGRNNPEDYTRPGPEFGAVYILRSADLSLEEKIWGRNQPTGLALSPDGRYMAFTDFLDDNLELYRID